ncbi:MAG: carboxypeptidase-like regulatory domain-containing protein, partial [Cyclobacteriaceae bacterium]
MIRIKTTMMTSKNFFSTIAALLLIGFVCSGQTGKVSGRVRDRDTQSPISLANVFINHSTIHALTNAAGEFSLSNIDQPAVYEVVVSFAGYESTKLKISLTDFEVKLGTIFLDRSK